MFALQSVGRSVFFEVESKAYRYWYRPSRDGLKIQMKREVMQAFRTSEVGRRLEAYVDIFELGGGWYEVHEGDSWKFRKFGAHVSGVKMWMRALNEAHIQKVNANPNVFVVVRKAASTELKPAVAAPSNAALAALTAKFSHHNNRVHH